jgi:hypothetical protein
VVKLGLSEDEALMTQIRFEMNMNQCMNPEGRAALRHALQQPRAPQSQRLLVTRRGGKSGGLKT